MWRALAATISASSCLASGSLGLRHADREQVDPAAHAVGVAREDLADPARVVAEHAEQLVAVIKHRADGESRTTGT